MTSKRQESTSSKPRVVFDPKMPRYEYRDGGSKSLSVDRKRTDGPKPPSNCLANLGV